MSPTDTPSPTNTPTPTSTPTPVPSPIVLSLIVLNGQGNAPLSVIAQLSATDPNTPNVTYIVDWGDASPSSIGTLNTLGPSDSIPHTFSFVGGFTVRAQAFDVPGASASASSSVSVNPIVDSDGDAMPDGYETAHSCLNPSAADGDSDADGDGLTNLAEYQDGTDPCASDTDLDGCDDARELGAVRTHGGQRDPTDAYDFFTVPRPALTTDSPNGTRDPIVNIADVIAVLFYVGTATGRHLPNANGVLYDTDLNANGVPDGQEYDRTPAGDGSRLWLTGPPNGAVTISDAVAALGQLGDACNPG